MNAKLEQIASIHAGYTFRKAEKGVTTFPYPVIQIKDVADDGTMNLANLATLYSTPVPERFLLQPGDVLFCSRGRRNKAAVFTGDSSEVVAGSQFFVVRAKHDQVTPEYLAWWINQPATQKELANRTHGSYIDMIPRDALADLSVPVPPIETQRRIVAVHELALREQRVMEKLKAMRADLVCRLCGEAAEKLSAGSKQ